MYIKLVATKKNLIGEELATIPLRVKEARKAAGLSQEDLGQKLGLVRSGYGHYERCQSFAH